MKNFLLDTVNKVTICLEKAFRSVPFHSVPFRSVLIDLAYNKFFSTFNLILTLTYSSRASPDFWDGFMSLIGVKAVLPRSEVYEILAVLNYGY
ncbi:MAG: hypothetical protein FWF73_00640 [Spirochaetes bacterium]|nr:hypothetical protein [Spirochaetota bacterium]